MNRKIRMGMVGGSMDGFIGNVHRMAAHLDGKIELVAGAFSSDGEKSVHTGQSLGLPRDRVYGSFTTMMEQETKLPLDERMEFVSIVTPNHLHYAPARLALEHGFHVMCEKPMTFNTEEASGLVALVKDTGLLFGLTHTYMGYPMVKEARQLIQGGFIGKIRKIMVEYPQGWLSSHIEAVGQKQASWRTDPAQAGISCCVADIGTHAAHLAEYMSGLKIREVAADISTFVEGRLLEDDANLLVRYEQGAKGTIVASQVSIGEENELKIRVYGTLASVEWLQSNPNKLVVKQADGSSRILKTGNGNKLLSNHALVHTRLPGGHPEGYIEAMANLYRNFAMAVEQVKNSSPHELAVYDFPSVEDGLRGMRFIEAVITSGKNNAQWMTL